MKNVKKIIKIVTGLLISIIAIVFLFRKISFKEFLNSLQKANYPLLLTTFLIYFLIFTFITLRFQFLLKKNSKKAGFLKVYKIILCGYLGNIIFPLRLGELIKIYLLSKYSGQKSTLGVSVLFIEKMFDLLFLILLFSISLLLINLSLTNLKMIMIPSILLVILCSALFLTSLFKNSLKKLWHSFFSFLPQKEKIDSYLAHFAKSIKSCLSLSTFFKGLLYTLLYWLALFSVYYISLTAFHVHLPWYKIVLLMCIVALGVAVPSAPGYIGVFHFSFVYGLVLLGYTKEIGLPIAVAVHFLQTIFIGIFGSIAFFHEHVTFKEISNLENKEENRN